MTLDELRETEWFRTRPEAIQRAILAYPPDQKYLMPKTQQIVALYSYHETKDGECRLCTVDVLGRTDAPEELQPLFRCRVFDVPLTDLEPLE